MPEKLIKRILIHHPKDYRKTKDHQTHLKRVKAVMGHYRVKDEQNRRFADSQTNDEMDSSAGNTNESGK